MDRQIVYAAQVPQTTDILNTNKAVMTALAKLCSDIFGTSTVASGLACVPTSPASMSVNINPGQLYQMANMDGTAYSAIAADTTHSILKQGILLDAQSLAITAPSTAGYSQNYLVQATYQDADTNLTVLPYYNSANPTQAFNGPAGAGTPQATTRAGQVVLQLVAGTAAATGSQTTPAVTTGYVGLWVITVANGATTITASNIAPYNGAPFLGASLLQQVQNDPSIVGQGRNISMSVAAAATLATMTADELVLKSALGSQSFVLASFSKTINLATTGAGGMDTGSAPSNGYVALYAIFNPTSQASALLATNATASVAPSVYGGANMPAGYTASGLVSVWPTNSSGQFIVAKQLDRTVYTPRASGLSTSSFTSGFVSANLGALIPKNAKEVFGDISGATSASSNITFGIDADGANTGRVWPTYYILGQITYRVPLITPQVVYYTLTGSGTPSFQINTSGYTF